VIFRWYDNYIMTIAIFRFYAELGDFLPAYRKQQAFGYSFDENASVKNIIEGLGVPHTEIDLILVNGKSVDFSYRLLDGDRVSIYPVFESLDITPILHLRPEPLRQMSFILDSHLGRLAAYLRMLGFDTLFQNNYQDEELASISQEERRILLTRDRGLLMRSKVNRGYYVRNVDPYKQLIEVIRRFDSFDMIAPFQRCLLCNKILQSVRKDQIFDRLPNRTRDIFNEFKTCPLCQRIYWKGSHFDRMSKMIERLKAERGYPD
jgi:uncharacterized protein